MMHPGRALSKPPSAVQSARVPRTPRDRVVRPASCNRHLSGVLGRQHPWTVDAPAHAARSCASQHWAAPLRAAPLPSALRSRLVRASASRSESCSSNCSSTVLRSDDWPKRSCTSASRSPVPGTWPRSWPPTISRASLTPKVAFTGCVLAVR